MPFDLIKHLSIFQCLEQTNVFFNLNIISKLFDIENSEFSNSEAMAFAFPFLPWPVKAKYVAGCQTN